MSSNSIEHTLMLLREQGPCTAREAMCGPFSRSNWVLPGIVCIGPAPQNPMQDGPSNANASHAHRASVEDLQTIIDCGFKKFIDLRGRAATFSGKTYLQNPELMDVTDDMEYSVFEGGSIAGGGAQHETGVDRVNKLAAFIRHTVAEAIATERPVYIHGENGVTSEIVIACGILAVAYGMSGLRACSVAAAQHACRENDENVITLIPQSLKPFIKEVCIACASTSPLVYNPNENYNSFEGGFGGASSASNNGGGSNHSSPLNGHRRNSRGNSQQQQNQPLQNFDPYQQQQDINDNTAMQPLNPQASMSAIQSMSNNNSGSFQQQQQQTPYGSIDPDAFQNPNQNKQHQQQSAPAPSRFVRNGGASSGGGVSSITFGGEDTMSSAARYGHSRPQSQQQQPTHNNNNNNNNPYLQGQQAYGVNSNASDRSASQSQQQQQDPNNNSGTFQQHATSSFTGHSRARTGASQNATSSSISWGNYGDESMNSKNRLRNHQQMQSSPTPIKTPFNSANNNNNQQQQPLPFMGGGGGGGFSAPPPLSNNSSNDDYHQSYIHNPNDGDHMKGTGGIMKKVANHDIHNTYDNSGTINNHGGNNNPYVHNPNAGDHLRGAAGNVRTSGGNPNINNNQYDNSGTITNQGGNPYVHNPNAGDHLRGAGGNVRTSTGNNIIGNTYDNSGTITNNNNNPYVHNPNHGDHLRGAGGAVRTSTGNNIIGNTYDKTGTINNNNSNPYVHNPNHGDHLKGGSGALKNLGGNNIISNTYDSDGTINNYNDNPYVHNPNHGDHMRGPGAMMNNNNNSSSTASTPSKSANNTMQNYQQQSQLQNRMNDNPYSTNAFNSSNSNNSSPSSNSILTSASAATNAVITTESFPPLLNPSNDSDIPCIRGPTPTSNWAIRGRLCCGAMPHVTQGRYIEALGKEKFAFLISLREQEPEPEIIDAIATAAGDYRPQVFHFPLRDGAAFANAHQATEFLKFVRRVVVTLEREPLARAYVFCQNGHGRTGMFVSTALGLAYGLSGMRACNLCSRLHEVRMNSEGQDSPQTHEQRTAIISLLKG